MRFYITTNHDGILVHFTKWPDGEHIILSAEEIFDKKLKKFRSYGAGGASSRYTGPDCCVGHIGSETEPPEIEALPVGPERTAAFQAWQEKNEARAYEYIIERLPEAVEGRRSGGSIYLDMSLPCAQELLMRAMCGEFE